MEHATTVLIADSAEDFCNAKAPTSYQFMRQGYFCPDSKDCAPGRLVFNRSVSLKDSFKPGK